MSPWDARWHGAWSAHALRRTDSAGPWDEGGRAIKDRRTPLRLEGMIDQWDAQWRGAWSVHALRRTDPAGPWDEGGRTSKEWHAPLRFEGMVSP